MGPSDADAPLTDYILGTLDDALGRTRTSEIDDIYVVAFMLGFRDDVRHGEVVLSWNTRSHRDQHVASASSRYGKYLAEFSFTEFAHPWAAVIAGPDDAEGRELRRSWLEARGLWYEDADLPQAADKFDDGIWAAWVTVMISAARAIHERSRDDWRLPEVPVYIDGEGLREDLVEINRAANPAHFHELVERWATGPDGPPQ